MNFENINYKSFFSIEQKKDLYIFFSKKVFATEKNENSNKNSKIQKLIKKNKNTLNLIKRLNLIEV